MTALFGGGLTVHAAGTITEGFNNYTTAGLPEGWNYYGTAGVIVRETDTYKTKAPCVSVPQVNTDTYLITPPLTGDFSFWLRNQTKNYQASITAYACAYVEGVLTLGMELGTTTLAKSTSSRPDWVQVTFNALTGTRVALLLSRGHLDDFTYTPFLAAEKATLAVGGFASGSTFDFGTVAEGTTKTFMLSNIGKTELSISGIMVYGGYALLAGGDLTTIAGERTANVTIATPGENADGVLIITSNDADSPYMIHLTSTLKVPAPIMSVDMTAVAFGRVTASASQDITVSNTGDAELKAEIISDNADFTVTPASLTVAAGKTATLTITYRYDATAYGDHTATVTVTPNVGEVVAIAASALVKDPNIWEEDFEDGAIPASWANDGWAVSTYNYGNNGTRMAYAGLSSNNTLVTPRLQANKGQVLTFEVGGADNIDPLCMQYSTDCATWSEATVYTETGMTTFTAPAAGYYYLRFYGRYASVDNFCGFKEAPLGHDTHIVTLTTPATDCQDAYDLQGRKVTNGCRKPGLYIVDGRKMVIR